MKSHFLATLRSEDLPGGAKWRLLEPLIWYSERLHHYFVIPRRFTCDSYSVPALLAFLVFKIDRRPAFLHDYLYSGKESITREQADTELLDAMKACGIGAIRRRVIYDGPELFGWMFFKGKKTPPPIDSDAQPKETP